MDSEGDTVHDDACHYQGIYLECVLTRTMDACTDLGSACCDQRPCPHESSRENSHPKVDSTRHCRCSNDGDAVRNDHYIACPHGADTCDVEDGDEAQYDTDRIHHIDAEGNTASHSSLHCHHNPDDDRTPEEVGHDHTTGIGEGRMDDEDDTQNDCSSLYR